MRTMTRRARRDRPGTRDNDALPEGNNLPDGIGGTITGGPMEPIDLLAILEGGRAVSRSGAVSGAAQVVVSNLREEGGRDRGIALSDGSRISFASIADAGLLSDDDALDAAPAEPSRHSRMLTDA